MPFREFAEQDREFPIISQKWSGSWGF